MCLRAGTRSSRLAVWQTELVTTGLRQAWPGLAVERVLITTLGDRISDVPLPRIGDKGVFTRELEDALRAGTIDLAVHSLKDLPTDVPRGLTIGAVLQRADPRDALVAASPVSIDTLQAGARVGTSSLRRRAQLLARRPDLDVRDLRGNVPTRVDKVLAGDLDAAVLAVAGLTRLGLSASHRRGARHGPDAAGAGSGSAGRRDTCRRRAHRCTGRAPRRQRHTPGHHRGAVAACRTRGRLPGPGRRIGDLHEQRCHAPGGTGHRSGWTRRRASRGRGAGDRPCGGLSARPGCGRRFACRRCTCHPRASAANAGGAGGGRAGVMSGSGPLVVVTREADAGASLARALERHGLRTWSVPTVATALPADTAALDAAIESLPDADWLVFTSARAVAPMCGRQAWRRLWPQVSGRINVAAVGPVTAGALAKAGVVPKAVATGGGAELVQAMAATPPGLAGTRLVWPRSDVARQEWKTMAEAAGARVTAPVAYLYRRGAGRDARQARGSHRRPPGPGRVVLLAVERGVVVTGFCRRHPASLERARRRGGAWPGDGGRPGAIGHRCRRGGVGAAGRGTRRRPGATSCDRPWRVRVSFPTHRLRRLRRTEALRQQVRETRLSPDNLVAPLFVCEGEGQRREIPSMPGCHQMSVDVLVEECRELASLGVPAVILFGLPAHKDAGRIQRGRSRRSRAACAGGARPRRAVAGALG